ncbi:MAG: hypothetical protein AAF517_27675, partial [Planctomycetota bacterium]
MSTRRSMPTHHLGLRTQVLPRLFLFVLAWVLGDACLGQPSPSGHEVVISEIQYHPHGDEDL